MGVRGMAFARDGLAQHGYLARVCVHKAQNGLDGGGFARAVFPNKAHDRALRHAEVHIAQAEA